MGKSRDVSLIETLYQQRKQSDVPWFIHAAYRAIDHILIGIEAFGGKEELSRLESLYKKLFAEEGKNFHEGVQTRMEWTVDRLKERENEDEKVKMKNEKVKTEVAPVMPNNILIYRADDDRLRLEVKLEEKTQSNCSEIPNSSV